MKNLRLIFFIVSASTFSKEILAVGNESSPAPYIIFSSYFSAANICFSTFNTIQIVKGTEKKTIPIFGLFTGATQILLGAGTYSSIPDMKALSITNIGIGSATMLLSTWNLVANKNTGKKKTTLTLYSMPINKINIEIGISFSCKF